MFSTCKIASCYRHHLFHHSLVCGMTIVDSGNSLMNACFAMFLLREDPYTSVLFVHHTNHGIILLEPSWKASMLVCWSALQNWNSFLSPSTQLMHTFSAEYFQFLHSEWTLIFGTGCLSYKQGVKELWGPKCSIAHVERYCNPVALGQALHFQFIGLLKSCMFIHTLHCPFSF